MDRRMDGLQWWNGDMNVVLMDRRMDGWVTLVEWQSEWRIDGQKNGWVGYRSGMLK